MPGGDATQLPSAYALDDDITLPSAGTFTEPGLGNDLVEGEKLPNVDAVRDPAGNEVSTADLVGQPLVINVWATSCAPCKEEMPALARISIYATSAIECASLASTSSPIRLRRSSSPRTRESVTS